MKPFFFILGWVLLAIIVVVAWDARRRAKLHAAFDQLARELGLTWTDGRLVGTIEGVPVTIEADTALRRAPWLVVRARGEAWTGPATDALAAARSMCGRARVVTQA